jgi:hypothetical protein
MNGRVYDPRLARFLSPDPLLHNTGNSQSFNHYSYCLNNPLKYTDPTGYDEAPYYRPGVAFGYTDACASGYMGPGSRHYWSDGLDRDIDYGTMSSSTFVNMYGQEKYNQLTYGSFSSQLSNAASEINRNSAYQDGVWSLTNVSYNNDIFGFDFGFNQEATNRVNLFCYAFERDREGQLLAFCPPGDKGKQNSPIKDKPFIRSPYGPMYESSTNWGNIKYWFDYIDTKLDGSKNGHQAPLVLKVFSKINPLVTIGNGVDLIFTGHDIFNEQVNSSMSLGAFLIISDISSLDLEITAYSLLRDAIIEHELKKSTLH